MGSRSHASFHQTGNREVLTGRVVRQFPALSSTTHRRRKFSSPQSSHQALGGAFVAVRGAGEQVRASGLKPLRAPGVRGWGYYTYFRRCSRQGKMSKIVPTHLPVYGSVAVSVID